MQRDWFGRNAAVNEMNMREEATDMVRSKRRNSN